MSAVIGLDLHLLDLRCLNSDVFLKERKKTKQGRVTSSPNGWSWFLTFGLPIFLTRFISLLLAFNLLRDWIR